MLSQPYGITFRSLKDPEWEPPTKPDTKSKPTLDQADANSNSTSFPTIVRMPIELKRTMQQRVQKAAMPEGDRTRRSIVRQRRRGTKIHPTLWSYTS